MPEQNTDTVTARENARTKTGQFGTQDRTQPTPFPSWLDSEVDAVMNEWDRVDEVDADLGVWLSSVADQYATAHQGSNTTAAADVFDACSAYDALDEHDTDYAIDIMNALRAMIPND